MYSVRLFSVVCVTLLLAAAVLAGAARAQGPAGGRIEPPRDPIMETDAKHNLQVARWYLTKRKAYQGALDRFQEIVETYPEFSRIDEVYYWMGEANAKLNKSDKAIEYYEIVVKKYPGSEFAKKAGEQVAKLKNGAAGK